MYLFRCSIGQHQHRTCRLSIEILPGGAHEWITLDQTSPFLFVEKNLGVPKKVLYRLYIEAIVVFKEAKGILSERGAGRSDPSNLIASSSVILLANPAHQTALNARKHLVQKGLIDPHRELEFTAALQSARECAKECILWDHRRWLFRRLYAKTDNSDGQPRSYSSVLDIPPKVIQKEFSLISKACEVYPRNYYAWNHWHFCMEALHSSFRSNPVNVDCVDVLHEFLHLRQWVETHVSDHSSVHHLCNLSRRLLDLDVVDFTSFYEHALSLVMSYPSHESLWLYLRAAVDFSDNQLRRERISQISSSVVLEGQLARRSLAWWELWVCWFLYRGK